MPAWVDRAARVVLLLALLVGGGASLLPQFATTASLAALDANLSAGRVAVATVEGSGTVRWSADWWRWRRAAVPAGTGDREAWLRDRVAGRAAPDGGPVTVARIGGGLVGRLAEPVWEPLRWTVLAAGLAAFALMFARRRRWFADRSGWFWFFVGGLGAPLFLLLEPEPLWSRPGRAPRWSRWRRLPLGPIGGFLLGWLAVSSVVVTIDLLV